jgi:mRNA-degrading endonuclease toxin of MazEF toxin-antitoxin module
MLNVKKTSALFILLSLTTNIKKLYSFESKILPSKSNGLSKDSKLMLRQVRVISLERVHKKLGSLEKKYHKPIRESLKVLLDLNGDF